MQVPVFNALCLLPDTEPVRGYSIVKMRGINGKWRYRECAFSLEQVEEFLVGLSFIQLVRRPPFGYLLRLNPAVALKADRVKAKRYTYACGLKFVRKGSHK